MNALSQQHLNLGARLAPDHIPLEYGDLSAEFEASQNAGILLDRSHEGRILLTGDDRLELVNRMSTNDVSALVENEGRATIFTNATARILFRAACFQRQEGLLLISEASQGSPLASFLRRNIFFGDQVSVNDISAITAQFSLHGDRADAVVKALDAQLLDLPAVGSSEVESDGCKITVARRKPICGGHWSVICPAEDASALHRHLLRVGGNFGLKPAGSLTYNVIRIQSGRPAGLELSTDYIPLEVGLWDEVSISKGCYTGQEIIARMESRGRLAKTIVKIGLSNLVPAPSILYADGRSVGVLTSSAKAPDGSIYALAVIKVDSCRPGNLLSVERGDELARVIGYAGAQPSFIRQFANGI